jgi:hypothetical protein
MYGTNLERRIFDKILYEVDSSDIPSPSIIRIIKSRRMR